jgi:hypothetical protein
MDQKCRKSSNEDPSTTVPQVFVVWPCVLAVCHVNRLLQREKGVLILQSPQESTPYKSHYAHGRMDWSNSVDCNGVSRGSLIILGCVPILSSLVPYIPMQPCLLALQCCVAVKERGCNIWMVISLVRDSPWTHTQECSPLTFVPAPTESQPYWVKEDRRTKSVFALLCSYPIPFSTFCFLRVAFLHRTIQRYYSWRWRCVQPKPRQDRSLDSLLWLSLPGLLTSVLLATLSL